jgi:hypothetical protein
MLTVAHYTLILNIRRCVSKLTSLIPIWNTNFRNAIFQCFVSQLVFTFIHAGKMLIFCQSLQSLWLCSWKTPQSSRPRPYGKFGVRGIAATSNTHQNLSIYKIWVGKPEGNRPLGSTRRRWEDNIRIIHIKRCKHVNCIEVAVIVLLGLAWIYCCMNHRIFPCVHKLTTADTGNHMWYCGWRGML